MSNFNESKKQLSILGRDTFVFQTFDDTPQKRPQLTDTFWGSIEEHYDSLKELNEQGAGVFVTVNRTQGSRRKNEDIVARSAHFADSDNGSIEGCELEPSMIIQSAHGQHYYWVLSKESDLSGFSQVQKEIAKKLNTDPSVNDPARVMRLAGFFNNKNLENPFLVTVTYSDGPKYELDSIKQYFKSNIEDSSNSENPTPSLGSWEVGNRNNSLYKFFKNIQECLPQGMNLERFTDYLQNTNIQLCSEPLSLNEIKAFAASHFEEYKNGSKTKAEIPLYFTLEAMDEMDFKEGEPIVKNYLLKGNLSILAAKPKVGKSTLVRYLIKCITDSESFIGMDTTKCKILYLPFEENLGNIKRDFNMMGIKDKSNVTISTLPDVKDKFLGIERLIGVLKPSLVIIDTFIHALNIDDSSDYTQTTRAIKKYREICEKYDCHVMFVHHAKKGDDQGNDSVLGSTGITGAVDVIIIMTIGENDIRKLSTTGRVTDLIPNQILSFNADTKSFSSDPNYKENLINDEIFNFILKNGSSNYEEIKSEVKRRDISVRNSLTELIDAKKIVKVQAGRLISYEVAATSSQSDGGANDLY